MIKLIIYIKNPVGGLLMKHKRRVKNLKKCKAVNEEMKKILEMGGKMIHGTRGKPTRGPRGNKKY